MSKRASGVRQSTSLPGVDLGTGKPKNTGYAPVPITNNNSGHFQSKQTSPFAIGDNPAQCGGSVVEDPHKRGHKGGAFVRANPLLARNHTDEFVKALQRQFGFEKSIKKDTPAETSPPRVSWLALLSYSTLSERIWMSIGIVFATFAGLCLPAWLILLARALDSFSRIAQLIVAGAGEEAFDVLKTNLMELCISFGVLGAISLCVGFVYVSIWTYTGERQALRIKEKFVKSALRQDAEWFDTNNREELPTAIANAMVHIQGAVGRPMADLWANFVSAMASLAVALVMNTPLALVMLCVVPIVSIIIMIVSCFTRKWSKQGSQKFVEAGALATEVISGMKTIASLCAEKWALASYTDSIMQAQKHSIYSGSLTGLMTGVTGLLFYCTYTVAFTIGTQQVSESMQLTVIFKCALLSDDPQCRVSGADVMCCIYGVILCATFFGLMAPGLNNINLGRQAAAQIYATINRTPEIDAESDFGAELEELKGDIVFKKLFFAYPSNLQRVIFSDFNLHIKAGQSVAFCGPSGSGKSTIAKLMLRFYCPQAGKVMIDGHPLGSLKLSWWRKQVGYVAQSPILFPGTIRYNIACGLEGATEADVIEAAKAACAHKFILDLPDGYDTYYSGASVQLSGGQMQRLCIARAMIRKPVVLLLDEATSALDTNSERQVQDALEHIRTQKSITTISVAHRLSTIVHCDQIAVISDGAIAELGNHQALLANNGIYASLCASQGISADSTFDTKILTVATGSKDDIEVEQPAPDVENGLTAKKAEEQVIVASEEEVLEDIYANRWRIINLNKQEWGYLFIGVIGALAVGALSPAEAILTARIVEKFYTADADKLMEEARPDILSFLFLGAAAFLGNILSGCGFSVAGYRLSARMRTLVFEAIIRRNIGWFDYPEHSVGELTSRLEADSEEVAKLTGWALGYRIRVFASLVSGVIIALVFSWQVGLTAICCVPIIMASSFVQICCLERKSADEDEGLSPESIFENGLRGIDAVQSYGLQTKVAEDYSEALIPQSKNHTKMGIVAGLVYGLSQFATFGSFAVVFYVGVELLVNQKVNFIEFFTPVLAVMFGALGIAAVNADFNAQQDGLAAASRIFKIIDEPLDEMDPFNTGGETPGALNGSLVFKDCTFAYPTRPNKFIYYASEENNNSGFNLNIGEKQAVAFVGESGCGKSTGLQILLRFYKVSSGEVLLDGHKLEDINISWLRSQIGYVGQNPTLFNGTIRDNILLGNPNATEAEIIAAAKAANAHNFIMQQGQGYDTDIGSGGSLLSGGQRQRIAITRAIVRPNVKFLVLDEATSALDNESEKIVQAALDNLQKTQPRTTLVVAHRLKTVQDCDEIAVLGHGGVLELGSHTDLLEKKALYHELWEKQGAS